MINWRSFFERIPADVKIGKTLYQIFWVDEFKDKRQLGETNFGEEKYIVINFNQTKKETVHTYWHELLHAISEEFEVGLTENQVLKLEKSLPFLLKDGNIFKKEENNGKISRDSRNKRKRRNIKRIR